MISRRHLLGAGATGIVAGLVGVSVMQAHASIRFIGRRSTIIALLDTGSERVLLVLGAKDDDLLANIPGLKTVGNSRVDLVIATHRILTTRIAREHLQVGSTPVIAVQGSASLAPIRGDVSVISMPTELQVGDMASMRITPAKSASSGTGTDHPEFAVSINLLNTTCVLGTSDAALRPIVGGACDLLAVPGSPGSIATTRIKPQLLVSNAILSEGTTAAQLQVYWNDPVVVRIENGGLRLRDYQPWS